MSALHYTILKFFEARMDEHDCVEAFTRLPVEGEYVYLIERTHGRSAINVLLSDAYRFGVADFLGRPGEIGKGDFILIAKPHGDCDDESVARARREGIGLGDIRKLMGALNLGDVSKYLTPAEKEAQKGRRN